VGKSMGTRRASLLRVGLPPPLAHSARRRGSLVGVDAVVGVEAGKSGRRRGGRGGHALECGQVRAGRVVPPPVGTLI
jgi:hypothetical protein